MAGNQRCTFVDRDPIYLLAVTSTGEPREYIEKQLDYIYHQVLFVLTGSVLTRLRKRPNYDVRDLMGGASRREQPQGRRADARPPQTRTLPFAASSTRPTTAATSSSTPRRACSSRRRRGRAPPLRCAQLGWSTSCASLAAAAPL